MTHHLINATVTYHAHIYEPYDGQYYIGVGRDDLPAWAWSYLPNERRTVLYLKSRLRPAVIYDGLGATTVLQNARDSNISPDQLLTGIPMSLLVQKIPRLDYPPMLAIVAIKVDPRHLIARCDEIITNLFKDC